MSNINEEDQKKMVRMNIIYKALEDGWSVKKSNADSKTFEFTKNKLLDNDYKGLVVFSKTNICEDIQKHLENIKNDHKIDEQKAISKRSVSTPIIKNRPLNEKNKEA
jgi:hypothetical protein